MRRLFQIKKRKLMNYTIIVFKIIRVKNILEILNEILDVTEQHGIGALISHNAVLSGEILKFEIQNEIAYNFIHTKKKFEIAIESNKTLYDLRKVLAKLLTT